MWCKDGEFLQDDPNIPRFGGHVCTRCNSSAVVNIDSLLKCFECGHTQDISQGESLFLAFQEAERTCEE